MVKSKSLAKPRVRPGRQVVRQNSSPISPLALDAVRRIDALFEIERSISG